MPQTLRIPRWEDFESAFIIGSPDARYFLHLESGTVEYTSHLDGETVRSRVLRQTSGPGWVELPRASTPEGMAEVQAFIEAEEDGALRAELRAALESRLGFVKFNRTLGRYADARARWAAARMRGIHQRILTFCRQHDLDVDHDRFRAIIDELG